MTSQRDMYGADVYRLRAIEQRPWAEIYDAFPDIPSASLRRIFYQEREERGELSDRGEAPVPHITNADLGIDDEMEDAVWEAAKRQAQARRKRERRKENRSVEFDHGPVALAFFADLHLGGSGVDYDQLDRDIATVENTPGMYIVSAGDWIDNYVIGRLLAISADMDLSIMKQWILVRRTLARMAPRMVISVGGNHDAWTRKVGHIDYLADLHDLIAPQVIYDGDDAMVAVRVGPAEYRLRVRHKWPGSSIYNDSHGIERASKFDKGRSFDVGVGAHDHRGSMVREFNNGGRLALAVKCGSYKVHDDYAEEIGFPQPSGSAVPVVVFEEDGFWGTGQLHLAARYMRAVYSGEPEPA